MRMFFLSALIALLSTSCASIFNGPYKKVQVHTTQAATVYYNEGSVKTVDNIASFEVKRKKDTMQFSVLQDTSMRTYAVNKKHSFAFWSNIPLKFGVGMLVDFTNPKRFTYPSHIYLDSSNTNKGYDTFEKKLPKGRWEFQVDMPFVNLFHREDPYGYRELQEGFFGVGLGINHFYRNNTYLNFSAHSFLLSNYPLPPPFIVFEQKTNKEFSYQLTLSNNHRIQKFNLGYGLAYVFNRTGYTVRLPDTMEPQTLNLLASTRVLPGGDVTKIAKSVEPGIFEQHWRNTQSFGMWFPISYELTKGISASFQYRPTFYRDKSTMESKFENLYSFGLIYRMKL
ncbi:hypothetical protein [Sphingobacterium hotanense]|uniref:Outer membrane protein beta-barrel domain-containing protein n=1 Tax=Sphingobacterium hotanense TaxID=649196 RepID=A0ABT7NJD6_9SPHI|nr:hypothetical protein [Sphingobacterium hotanense]MDM1047312.1 hypothetical protein [Sphingobacterium hotanense]